MKKSSFISFFDNTELSFLSDLFCYIKQFSFRAKSEFQTELKVK